MSGLSQDLRFATRTLSKHRAFTSAAVLTLALGIGATAAIFSVVYGVLLKPLPFAQPDRLVSVMHHGTLAQLPVMNHGPATFFAATDNQRAFEGIGGWDRKEASITGAGEPERVEALAVTSATLPLLRIQPLVGRFFRGEDDASGTPLHVILTYGFWQRRFGGAGSVIGQRINVDGEPAEIVGVLPRSFTFLQQRPAILFPLRPDREARGIQFGFQAFGRLKPGVTLAQAEGDMKRWLQLLPPTFEKLGMTPYIRPLSDEVTSEVKPILWILFGAVGIVLLVACGNVANLFLVRGEARQQELALRAALGASRGDLAQTLLSESVTLGLLGGVLGLTLAQGAIQLIRQLAPVQLPRIDDIGIDWVVLLFTIAVSICSGIVFGFAAVARFAKPSSGALKEGGRGASDGRARHGTRNVLVVAQVAMALTLMIASGLMIRTFMALRDVPPGFREPKEVLTFRIAVPEGLDADNQRAVRTHENIAARLAAVPGVSSVGLATSITMDGEDNGNPVYAEDVPLAQPPLRRFKSVGPGYFETMGAPVVAGRAITWSDIHEARPVVMISETLAREYWGDAARAIGRRLRSSEDAPWREVVGVVGPERDDGLSRPPTAIVYWPMMSESYRWRTMSYVVRSPRAGNSDFLRELQNAAWSVNRDLPLATIQTLDEIQARSMAQTTFMMVMLAIAGSVALILGVVGIYGVIAYVATQRTRETGIRLALGAQVGDIRTLFLRQGLSLALVGIAIGIVLATAVSRVVSSMLFGVARVDPVTYLAMTLVLGVVALAATYLPARRASRVDPAIALRDS